MRLALRQAVLAAEVGDVPVGAVIVRGERLSAVRITKWSC